ncbi:TPA: hypothetical protein IXF72_000109 [Enterococcus faecium]|nr:hypothetical protein [Enterococcus faecium]
MNNNEKILHVLDSFEEIRFELKKYRDILEQRYDFVNQQKSNHMDFVITMSDLKKELSIRKEKEKLINAYFEIGEQEVKKAMELNDDQRIVDQLLEQLLEMFRMKKIDEDLISEGIKKYSTNSAIAVVLKAIYDEDPMPFIPNDDMETALEYIKYYSQGITVFREFDAEDVILNLKKLKEWCEVYEIDDSGLDYLIRIMEIEEEMPEKPDPSHILELIHEVRKPNAYISRGYTVLEFYKPYISAMNHLRRVLRERREYRSVLNASNRLEKAVYELESYYRNHYLQAGGMPRNTKANIRKYEKLTDESLKEK